MSRTMLVLPFLLAAAPASAAVVSSADAGFILETKVTVAAAPARAWNVLLHPGLWWEDAHTYSGDSANMTIDPRAGGCWCEKLANGSVEHMRVVFIAARTGLRMVGGLGPLQSMPVQAVMNVTLKPEGSGTEVTFTYSVGGYQPGGLGKFAPAVDGVMGIQFAAFKKAAESAK